MSLLERFQAAFAALQPGPSLALGVSGGVDSMVLMHLCARAGLRPLVVSLDHGLRPESPNEVRLVAQQAAALDLPFQGRTLGLEPGADLAQRARRARLGVWKQLPVDHVLLAHHLDDQAETVLDRLVRGAGARGLGGMRAAHGKLLRPLLGQRRVELVAWAKAQGVQWVEDPSNTKGTRGALRHKVLPELERLRPGAAACIARSAGHLAQDSALLEQLASALLGPEGIPLEPWKQAPAPLRRRAIAQLVQACCGHRRELASAHLDAAYRVLGGGRGVLEIPGGWRLVAEAGLLRCLPPLPKPQALSSGTWGLWRVHASAQVKLRAALPGERIQGKRLVDWMRAAGVPAALRAYHPVVEVGAQRWMPGLCFQGPRPEGVVVTAERPRGASVPGGGPFQWTL